jgi:anti-anti-sigma factor
MAGGIPCEFSCIISAQCEEEVFQMEIDATAFDNVTAVTIKGRVDSTNAEGLKERLVEIIRSGSSQLVIDLKEVMYISSAGFRTLLITGRAVEQASGCLVLCGIVGQVKKLFDAAAFSELFTILPTLDEAVASLRVRSGTQQS